ncbi:hypothetical protein GIY30_14215 [Gordonia sp. HNM0687]|uniref:Uncharacterized protein n=1 Tax=Gordonia mangrovi TaxID=2665643 RepID=A0A6L7GSU3_9ACTN|nr:hypothetical protein [Gordonia mangrovi]MXP22497.1 hypothetical protein [Gordonia mangrovi]UVF77628.1 hypothetical protein NWF22_20525 [Gordonia mangrovi]
MSNQAAAGSGGGRLQADLAELAELSERVGAAHLHIGRLMSELDSALSDADAAIGVDEAARAFRSGFASQADAIRREVQSAAIELDRHRALIRRGIRDLDTADHDVALSLTRDDR